MKQTTFQHPELRDANDNIIQAGTYGKESPLVNGDNTGVLDYINNNLEALHDNINGARIYVANKAALPATGDLSAMYIAEDTGKWYLWNGSKYIETDNARKIADEAIAARDMAKAWAQSTSSPDGAADTASPTGKTQSSKTWALYSKDRATAAASSASSAASSAATASTKATDASTSATAAANSASAAKTSENNAAASKSAAAILAAASTASATDAKAAANAATDAKNSAQSYAQKTEAVANAIKEKEILAITDSVQLAINTEDGGLDIVVTTE